LPYKESGQDVFPSETTLVIRSGGQRIIAEEMLWGFSNPYRKGLVINARAETVRDKNLFADSIMNRRCVIPASGFYEWDPYKARFRFTDPKNGLLFLAGIYHEEQGKPHYTILTTQANDSMQPVHDRMPVMISRNELKPWLNDDERLTDFLERPQVELAREQDSGQIRIKWD
jgi:putative SOS response-associated peptidase YedK